MAVFRVEKNTDYTVMSNHHLRNKELSLKSKGLLSQILSLPADWDYSLEGLASINKEKIDAIRTSVKELEDAGYIIRRRERDEDGRLGANIYCIYEFPQKKKDKQDENASTSEKPTLENPTLEKPTLEKPTLENPTLENPTLEKPTLENPMQLNKDILNKDLLNKDISLLFTSFREESKQESKRSEPMQREHCEELIKENISYDALIKESSYSEQEQIEELKELIVDTVCSTKKTIRISGEEKNAEMVKARFLKLNKEHIEFILYCLKKNTTLIRNIKQYLIASLYNAPVTISNYYDALVQHNTVQGL